MNRFVSALIAAFVLFSCSPTGSGNSGAKITSVAVFIPGILQGSPTYELLDAGVRKAVSEVQDVKVKTIEGGFNQAQWGEQIAALAASGEYNLIVTSNPAMPEICAKVATSFPQIRFVILEAVSTNPAIASLAYNHKELAYLHGYLAGLIAADKKAPPAVGMIVGQEYPEMNNLIRPGVEEGIKAVNPAGKVEFRVVGNWYDASKGEELAKGLYGQGIAVILPIAGSANQGVLTAAKNAKKGALSYDIDAYALAKGVIVGSGAIKQDKASYELVKAAIEGKIEYGKPRAVGFKEGYIDYLTDAPDFKASVSEKVAKDFAVVVEKFRTGALSFPTSTAP